MRKKEKKCINHTGIPWIPSTKEVVITKNVLFDPYIAAGMLKLLENSMLYGIKYVKQGQKILLYYYNYIVVYFNGINTFSSYFTPLNASLNLLSYMF